jgi:predicted RNA-binding protein YlxR (DUF448 family)
MKGSCPIRTCLGCGKKFPKKKLVKFVLQNGFVVLDSSGKAGGRSGYCCNDVNCIKSFVHDKRKRSRAFRDHDCKISVELKDWE